ncbi:ABC transporter permease [Shewanella benthica]|uniref:ABC transporter permease n=1 Tax=Shewanella benthica TaxID=43661 RepID=UPI00187A1DBC|nr:ABC transporter permease [Shewanella benthica]MBE7215107.1 ABC transporter permease [Shewanella benthica]MCL1062147.1 ABC transporter permease [Shewanella benthica]
MLLKLAWRNLWRQKRRTILTACALALALILSLVMRSTQEGSYANNIENSARFSTGLIQLQHADFAESQSIDDLLPENDAFIDIAKQISDVERALPRIESFSLAAAGEKSKGVMVLGVMPELEDDYSGIASKLVDGEFLTRDDKQVLIGQGLAEYFELDVGDEIVLYGQGYRGQTAAGLYTIKGVLHFPISQLDNQLIYMPLPLAQILFSTDNQVTSWVLHTRDLPHLEQTVNQLKQVYSEQGEAAGFTGQVNLRDWQDLSPEMAQQIAMDKAGGIFMMYLLYGVVGFGLFATILMMTLERQREFGVMLATGLLRPKLLALVILESSFISLLGIVIGLVIATPVLIWFNLYPIQLTGETAQLMLDMGWEPIIPMMLAPRLFIDQVLTVLVLMLICLIYPLWRVYRLDLVTALKGGEHAH